MAVFLPTAATGNGRLLVTVGHAAEIMGVFYPRIDFACNVRECMPALYLGHPQAGRFIWSWQDEFDKRQYYLGLSDVVVTELRLRAPQLLIVITDFVPPGETALIRRVRVENRSGSRVVGAFMHYFWLTLGEVAWKQAVRFDDRAGRAVQYFRDVAVAVGGTAPDMWRCGKSGRGDEASAKVDMLDGHLNGQPEDIGPVDFALAWRLDLEPEKSREIVIVLAWRRNRWDAVELLEALAGQSAYRLQGQAQEEAARFLERRRRVLVPPAVEHAYQRAILSIRLISDAETGAILAAPEFDPAYEACGGYGYCWPRDAVDAAMAMEQAGYPEFSHALARWLARVQMPDGLWGQRYWLDGPIAASWSLRQDFLQLDQAAAALMLLAHVLLAEGSAASDAELVGALERGTQALLSMVDDDGFHKPACDLWETYRGVFAYTNAAVWAALTKAAAALGILGRGELARRAEAMAERVRSATLSLFRDGYFFRGKMDGHLDPTVDSSTLGLVEPFAVLDLTAPEHWQMALANLNRIQQALTHHLPEGPAIGRYQGDGYLGGLPGAVNTLWAAVVCYRLAQHAPSDAEAQRLAEQGDRYVQTVLARRTPTGLLPELLGRPDGWPPWWAAPHAWASGLLIRCAIEADKLARRLENRQPAKVEAARNERMS